MWDFLENLDWTKVVENAVAGLLVAAITAFFAILVSKKFRHFLIKLLTRGYRIIRRNYKDLILLAIIIVVECLLYSYYKNVDIIILTFLQGLMLSILIWLLFKKPPFQTKSNPFTFYPFEIMVGDWDLTFGPNDAEGSEPVKIDNEGNYFAWTKPAFILKDLHHNISKNEISYNKVQLDGNVRQREILRITNPNLLEGYKEGNPAHKLIYKRHR